MVDTPDTASVVPALAEAGVAAAEIALPVLLPFAPLISLALAFIRGHYAANGTLPTDAEVIAALPQDYQELKDVWANWKPSGR
jgi:hypothetical protein